MKTIKKSILTLAALLLAGTSTVFADGRDRPITIDRLPVAAQTFLKTHFADLTLAYAVEDPQFIGSEYEVTYTNRTEVEFASDGEWTSVQCRYEPVPASIVPTAIVDYVAKSFNGAAIHKIERGRYTWEVEIANGLEIKFDRQFRVIDIDD